MEEKQRAERKLRKEPWTPSWFRETEVPVAAATMALPMLPSDEGDIPTIQMWTFKGTFWTEREKREKSQDSKVRIRN